MHGDFLFSLLGSSFPHQRPPLKLRGPLALWTLEDCHCENKSATSYMGTDTLCMGYTYESSNSRGLGKNTYTELVGARQEQKIIFPCFLGSVRTYVFSSFNLHYCTWNGFSSGIQNTTFYSYGIRKINRRGGRGSHFPGFSACDSNTTASANEVLYSEMGRQVPLGKSNHNLGRIGMFWPPNLSQMWILEHLLTC